MSKRFFICSCVRKIKWRSCRESIYESGIHFNGWDSAICEGKAIYQVEDGRLIQCLSTDEFAECGETVKPDTKLLFEPRLYTLRCQFLTLKKAVVSLRLLAKRIAKVSGNITGSCRRVSSTILHSTHNSFLDGFLHVLQTTRRWTKKDFRLRCATSWSIQYRSNNWRHYYERRWHRQFSKRSGYKEQ